MSASSATRFHADGGGGLNRGSACSRSCSSRTSLVGARRVAAVFSSFASRNSGSVGRWAGLEEEADMVVETRE